MVDVHERPEGANAADPTSSTEGTNRPTKPPWERSLIARWSELNLADPVPSGGLPKGAGVPDLLIHALICPGAADPVEGIIDGVRVELSAMADALSGDESLIADFLRQQVRRLGAAMQLLRWSDNRDRMPVEDDTDDEPPSKAPSEPHPEGEPGDE
jgi:hypothetical protein